jgi:hypothetical protein
MTTNTRYSTGLLFLSAALNFLLCGAVGVGAKLGSFCFLLWWALVLNSYFLFLIAMRVAESATKDAMVESLSGLLTTNNAGSAAKEVGEEVAVAEPQNSPSTSSL